jgi:hypothetical protein
MDGVIDFTVLSLDIPPPAADTPAAGSTGTSLFVSPLLTCSGTRGGFGLVLVLACSIVMK